MTGRHIGLLAALLFVACAGPVPDNVGVESGKLAPCPASPNCVSSDATDGHHTAPFRLAKSATEAWMAAREEVLSLPRTEIMEQTGDYLRAESRSPLLGFVDDLELHLRPEEGRIAVRAAARVGWSDLGTNRERVWELRRALKARGAIR